MEDCPDGAVVVDAPSKARRSAEPRQAGASLGANTAPSGCSTRRCQCDGRRGGRTPAIQGSRPVQGKHDDCGTRVRRDGHGVLTKRVRALTILSTAHDTEHTVRFVDIDLDGFAAFRSQIRSRIGAVGCVQCGVIRRRWGESARYRVRTVEHRRSPRRSLPTPAIWPLWNSVCGRGLSDRPKGLLRFASWVERPARAERRRREARWRYPTGARVKLMG